MINQTEYSENIFINEKGFKDITPVLFGWENCKGSHSFGPAVRDYYLLHCVVSGKGTFKNSRDSYSLSKGQLFLIRPGEITYYSADEVEPWSYIWIGFTGALADAFDSVPDVVSADFERLFIELKEAANNGGVSAELIIGNLYLIMARLIPQNKGTDTAPESVAIRAAKYIERSYMQPLSVEAIASGMHISRQYLSRLFKREYGVSLQEYIVSVRMRRALEFLEGGNSVSNTASMTGYTDVFNFSKMFKKYYGFSPSQAMKNRSAR